METIVEPAVTNAPHSTITIARRMQISAAFKFGGFGSVVVSAVVEPVIGKDGDDAGDERAPDRDARRQYGKSSIGGVKMLSKCVRATFQIFRFFFQLPEPVAQKPPATRAGFTEIVISSFIGWHPIGLNRRSEKITGGADRLSGITTSPESSELPPSGMW